MEISGKQYFEWCHQLFQQREEEADSHCDCYFSVAGRFTIRIRFAGKHLVEPFVRGLAHLLADPVENPDLTVCVWDNAENSGGILLRPFNPDGLDFSEKSKRHTCTNVQICSDLWPNRVSLFSAEHKRALFWINDIRQFPWYEGCRPLRNIIHWFCLTRQVYMVHAACIGTEKGGVLLTGKPGAGKSTSALSSLNSDLKFVADDLCLIGLEGNRAFAYNLYNAAKLENFEQLPHLEQHVFNRDRSPGEKAFMYIDQSFPEKLIKKVPLAAILVPRVTGERLSALRPMAHDEAFRTLVASTNEELGGTSATAFFGPYKICKGTPCYELAAGTDLENLNAVISAFLQGDDDSIKRADKGLADQFH